MRRDPVESSIGSRETWNERATKAPQAADEPLDDADEDEADADEEAVDFESDPFDDDDDDDDDDDVDEDDEDDEDESDPDLEPDAFADDEAGVLLDEELRLSFR